MNTQPAPLDKNTGGNSSNQPPQTASSAKSAGGKSAPQSFQNTPPGQNAGNPPPKTAPSGKSAGGKTQNPPPQEKSNNNNDQKSAPSAKSSKMDDDKKKKEDNKNKKQEEEKHKKEDAKNQKKEDEKHKKEEEKHKKEDAKNQKKEDEKHKKEEDKHKKEDAKKQKKEDEKHKKEDAKNQKKEEEKHTKEEEKHKKEDAKNQKKEDEKHKKEDAKNQKKEDEKHKKEDAKNQNKEEEKHKNEDEKKKKEEEKKANKDDKMKKNEEEKKKKNEEEKKKKNEEEKKKKNEEKWKKKQEQAKKKKATDGCGSCRAGVCKCWYCCWCHCLLPPFFWLFGVLLFGFSLYYALKYTLELDEDQQEDNLLFLYWGTLTYAVLFVIIVQMTYLLVLFESTNQCGIILYTILFASTFILCFVVLIFSIFCPGWGPRGKPQKEPVLKDLRWRERIPEQVFHILLAAAITLGLFIFVLHIYLYNTLQFLEEKGLRENKEAHCHSEKPPEDAAGSQKSWASVSGNVGTQQSFGRITKYHTESELNNNNTFASIARRYRSISYERSAPTKYTGSTYMGINTQFSTSSNRERYDSTC